MSISISVVIPTHARETRLAFALEALAGQTLSSDAFEVIVMRDPDSPKPWAGTPEGLSVRFLQSSVKGPVTKRNTGWQLAAAPLVAFIDDDTRPAADWLERVLEVADREAADFGEFVIQGRTEPDPDELHLLSGLARSIEITGPTGLYETCNLTYPRTLLERLGGFDPIFTLPVWGEDTDLGLRAQEAGARLVYSDDALVWHAVHTNTLPQAIAQAGRRRRFARLISRHPSLREQMPARLFVNRVHVGVAAAAVGLIAATISRRPAVAAVGALPYLLPMVKYIGLIEDGRVRPRRLARFAVHLPVRVAVDVVETAATVRGGIEERTLVI